MPEDEAERLAALQRAGVLDTPPEERFDRITRIAQALFEVPIVLVSLVDAERQWFKSRQGLDACETAREISFCGHAILADAPMVIADAHADPRFADNPLVTGEPNIRFYAGMPLHLDGHRVGILCLVDRRPRQLDAAALARLRDLADLVEQQLGQREMLELLARQQADNRRLQHTEQALAHANALLERSSHAAQIGTWEVPMDTRRPLWSPVTCAIHELPAGYRPELQEALAFYPAGPDRDSIVAAFEAAVAHGQSFDLELRLVTAAGHPRWVRAVGLAEMQDGSCRRVYGLFQDMTARRQAELAQREALRLARQQVELVFDGDLQGAPPQQALRLLARRLQQALGVERASAWRFDAAHTELRCEALAATGEAAPATPSTLLRSDYPSYFEALRGQSVLVVEDLRRDPASAELAERYLAAQGVGALLDAVIPGDAGPRGVLCCEHAGAARVWTTAERAFATAAAVFAAQLLAQSERRAAMDELGRSEQQLRALVEDMPGAAYRCALDNDWSMLYLSDGIEPLTGYPPDDFIANARRSYASIIHPDDRHYVERCVRQAIREARSWECEYRILHRDAGTRWVYEKGRAVRAADGSLDSLSGFIHDIDQRRRAERERAQATALLQAVLDSASEVSIIATDSDGLITLFNRGSERMLGWRAEDMVGQRTPASFHLEAELELRASALRAQFGGALDGFRTLVAQVERSGSEVREWTYVHRSGRHFPVMLAVTTIRDEAGQVAGYLGTAVDISAQREALAGLERSQRELRRFFELSTGLMAIIDHRGRLQRVNAAVLRALGLDHAAMQGRPLIEFVHPDDLLLTTERFTELERGADQVQLEHRLRRADGDWLALFWTLSRDPDSRRVYGAAVDITERQRLERLKGEFIATVSHELRTPLTSINGALGLIASGALGSLEDKPAQLIKVALGNGQRLALLINDLLDMERLAAERMQFDLQWHPLGELVTAALLANEPYANQREVSLVDAGGSGSLQIRVDLNRFLQVMSNLISNAAKFSPRQGLVEILCSADGERAQIAVRDDGPGIPAEFRARIFQKFSQADSSDVRQRGGTGLGLAITRELVEQMDGRIGFHSLEGEGSTFWVSFPARPHGAS
jgi:PAS domain S-box-containing protein